MKICKEMSVSTHLDLVEIRDKFLIKIQQSKCPKLERDLPVNFVVLILRQPSIID